MLTKEEEKTLAILTKKQDIYIKQKRKQELKKKREKKKQELKEFEIQIEQQMEQEFKIRKEKQEQFYTSLPILQNDIKVLDQKIQNETDLINEITKNHRENIQNFQNEIQQLRSTFNCICPSEYKDNENDHRKCTLCLRIYYNCDCHKCRY